MAKQYHFWLVAKDETGKPYLIYGCSDRDGEDAARSRGFEMLNGMDFQIRRYPTSNLAQASSFYRGKRLESGEGLRASTQRIGHDKSVTRRLARRRRLGL